MLFEDWYNCCYLDVIEKKIKGNDMNQDIKKDGGKLRMDLVPPEVLEELSKALTFGLQNGYKENSWKKVHDKRYKAAKMRHGTARDKGEIYDPESNLRHRSHELCNVMFLLMKEIYRDRAKNKKKK